ncbi:hypothetical protein IFM89_035239, partial [Coptis chinensis]
NYSSKEKGGYITYKYSSHFLKKEYSHYTTCMNVTWLEKKEHVSCLKTSGHNAEKCRRFSKMYLECRMAN